jgi:hypothetical protein
MSLMLSAPGDHPRDQRHNLRRGVHTALRCDLDPVGDQSAEPAPGYKRQHRRQPRARHEDWIIEPHRHDAASMR